MAALKGNCNLLEECGHTARLMILSGLEMKQTRVKAAAHIFLQNKKNGYVGKIEVFDMSVVKLSDISDNGMYYGGMLFVSSTSSHLEIFGRKASTVDAIHFQRVGSSVT